MELKLLIFVIIIICVLITVILVLCCFFDFFWLTVLLLFICSLWHLGCFYPVDYIIPSRIPCKVGLVVITSLVLFLLWEFLIYPLVLVDSFSESNIYTHICTYIWSFSFGIHISSPFWIENFLSNNQILFWWSCFCEWVDLHFLQLLISFLYSELLIFLL